jgi:hypothetical protein
MANLGKCLLFYLKYTAEMERLYEEDEPNLNGLPNPDQILEKIKLVGDTANREVAELLEACAPTIEELFCAISAIERVRNNLEKMWSLRFWVSPKRAKGNRFMIGVQMSPKRSALIPWLWGRGGRRFEDETVRVLGRGVKSATLG